MVLPTLNLGAFSLWASLGGSRGRKLAEGNLSKVIMGWDIAVVLHVVVIERTPTVIT